MDLSRFVLSVVAHCNVIVLGGRSEFLANSCRFAYVLGESVDETIDVDDLWGIIAPFSLITYYKTETYCLLVDKRIEFV